MAETIPRRRRTVWIVITTVAAIAIAFQHFRPWEGGLLEDWEFAVDWMHSGWNFYPDKLERTLGRPFHLFPAYLGLILTGGGVAGQFAILAVTAVLQFVIVLRLLRTSVRSQLIVVVVAFAVASHPLWAAGDILRFLPAQVSGLFVWLAILCWHRVADGARPLVAVGGALSLAIGLLTYQALALTGVLAALAIWAVTRRPLTRFGWIVGGAVAASAFAAVWSVVIAPRLVRDSYEASLGSGLPPLFESVAAIARTLGREAPWIVGTGVALVVLVTAAALAGRMPRRATVAVVAVVAASPLTALSYATTALHLNDPERVAFPVSTTLMVAAVVAVQSIEWRTVPAPVRVVTAATAAVATLVGGILGVAQWTSYGATQQWTLGVVREAVARADDDDVVLVRDGSGDLGDVYTLLPPHLWIASIATTGDTSRVELCTEPGVRDHPVAARYPIQTTEDCTEVAARYDDAQVVTVAPFGDGEVVVEIVQPVR